ncbi:putative transcriptional regulator [Bartonella sp. CDC_skunk]|uniref:YqgE/AlgH family protein n=1 Tax=unclassified Bartonella TaxID=2645622 RepID=UPI00099AA043|nr:MULTISPECIES: YqgE/AlgH family protein [unclassified Bartonella]AQX21715.1 putative transcriptional regulator [Bartonella sp. CDC_skunk]AQX26979.1 putative transcriptional regulator [Bartonella sp. Raccoon60]
MKQHEGFLNGQLLIAMPGMNDKRFVRSVIYICAHSNAGAMGIILNQLHDINFPELLLQLGVINQNQKNYLSEPIKKFPIRCGGPIDTSRGFVLHSDDYACEATISVTDKICLTTTLDVLKAMSCERGPEHALIALGYAGWKAGQLETEIYANGWLISPTSPSFLFESDISSKYDESLIRMGISPTSLISKPGHA